MGNHAHKHVFTPEQQEEVKRLWSSLKTPFKETEDSHAQLLRGTWRALQPVESFQRKSPQWKEMGFQGIDPITDIRAGGILSLACYEYFSTYYTHACRTILKSLVQLYEEDKERFYPVATTAVVITTKLCEILGIALPMRGAVDEKALQKLLKKKNKTIFVWLIEPEKNKSEGDWSGASFYDIFSLLLVDFHTTFFETKASYMDCQPLLKKVFDRLQAHCHGKGHATSLASLKQKYCENPAIKQMLVGSGGRARGWRLTRGVVHSAHTKRNSKGDSNDIASAFQASMELRLRKHQSCSLNATTASASAPPVPPQASAPSKGLAGMALVKASSNAAEE